MIQYISMILGLAIVVYMMIKGWTPVIIGIVASAVVILLNGLSYGQTMTEVFFTSFSGMFLSLFPPIFSGCLLAQTYTRSGAVLTIADTLTGFMFRTLKAENSSKRYTIAILTMVVVSGVISYCGMNSLVVLIAMYPIALRIMEKADIPKRFVMGILSGGVYAFALSAPGTTETVNILAMQAVGTPAYAGLVGGFAAAFAEVTFMTVAMSHMVKKATANGEHFAYGPKDFNFSQEGEDRKRPGLIVSMIPLLVLIVLFNVFSVNIFAATMIGWLLSVVLFWPNMKGKSELMETCAEGAKSAFGPVSSVGAFVGFTAVVQTLPNFNVIMDGIFDLRVPAAVILVLAISLVAGLTGSSTSAVRIGIPLVLDRCRAAGLTDAMVHRVSCFAATTIDTLPWSTAIIINLGIADLKLKDAYPSMFVATTLATAIGTVVCSLVMYFFPFLP